MPDYRSWIASIFDAYIRTACNGISRLLPYAFIQAINGLAFSWLGSEIACD